MRLTHPLLSEPIVFNERYIPVVILENKKVFRSFIYELRSQAEIGDGKFCLSIDYETIECDEHIKVITDYDYFSLDDRKLQNRFQALLQMIINEDISEETYDMQKRVSQYFEKIALNLDYSVSYYDGDMVSVLIKAMKFQPVIDAAGSLEKLIQYMDLYCGLMKDQCFILVNAHDYFTDEELVQFYSLSFYKKWRVLMLESHMHEPIKGENIVVIDKDLCELRVDFEEKL